MFRPSWWPSSSCTYYSPCEVPHYHTHTHTHTSHHPICFHAPQNGHDPPISSPHMFPCCTEWTWPSHLITLYVSMLHRMDMTLPSHHSICFHAPQNGHDRPCLGVHTHIHTHTHLPLDYACQEAGRPIHNSPVYCKTTSSPDSQFHASKNAHSIITRHN